MKSILKRIKLNIKKCLIWFDIFAIKYMSNNMILINLYYFIFSRQFDREHKSVMLGRRKYLQDVESGNCNTLLRRNIHRLEKGIIMVPRRPVFALNYIKETIYCLKDCLANSKISPDEIKWAVDVLDEYFSIVSIDKNLDLIHQFYLDNIKLKLVVDSNVNTLSKPYKQESLDVNLVDYESLLTLFIRRRSIRWYQDKSVDISLIHKAANAATLAPSACNRQPFQYYVINGNDKACEYAECAMGTAGFSKNLQCLIAVVGDLSAYPNERDRHVIYIDSSLFTMQFILALETIGLSSCVINWPDIDKNEKKLANKLNLPTHKRVTMLVAVGYPKKEGGIPFSHKKSSQDIIKEIN